MPHYQSRRVGHSFLAFRPQIVPQLTVNSFSSSPQACTSGISGYSCDPQHFTFHLHQIIIISKSMRLFSLPFFLSLLGLGTIPTSTFQFFHLSYWPCFNSLNMISKLTNITVHIYLLRVWERRNWEGTLLEVRKDFLTNYIITMRDSI